MGKAINKILISLGFGAIALSGSPAMATVSLNGSCSGAISVSGASTLGSCIGWYSGNDLNNSNNSIINSALTALGYSGASINFGSLPGDDKISGLNGAQTVNLPSSLSGIVYLGLHFGESAPGDAGGNTAFFVVNAVDLDSFFINYSQGSSNAVVLATTPAPSVPEPATWASMLLGFGVIGFAMRRLRATNPDFHKQGARPAY